MKQYKLNRYCFDEYEEVVFEHIDKNTVVSEALELSALDKPYTYAYRMETWENGSMVGGWRFFQNGREFTQDILSAVCK